MLRIIFIFIVTFSSLFANGDSIQELRNDSKICQFIQKHINENLRLLRKNPKLASLSDQELREVFNQSRTAHYIKKYQDRQIKIFEDHFKNL